MRSKALITFIVSVFSCYCLYAQKDSYKFSHLDITNGLSDNQVNCIYKDQKGFMWFGTTFGLDRYDGYKVRVFKHDAANLNSLGENHVLNIEEGPGNTLWLFTHSGISVYDPATEKFFNNIPVQLARYKISANAISLLKKDASGNFWFATNNKGLYCYHPAQNYTAYYNSSQSSTAVLHSNNISDIAVAGQNAIWLIYNDGVIEKLNTKSEEITRVINVVSQANEQRPIHYSITTDSKGNLWIYSSAEPVGAYRYDISDNHLVHFSKDSPVNRVNSNIINTIVQADDQKIWIGTDHGGINVVDPVTYSVTYLLSREDDPKSLSGNSVWLYKDNTGIIWAGTFKQGLNYYHSGIIQFPLYRHFATDKASLPFEDVNCFAEESSGNLWIGTNGGGLIYFNRTTNSYTQYKHDAVNGNSLSNDIIVKLFIDDKQRLWIGSYFGGLDRLEGGKFVHYRHNEQVPSSLSDDRVYTICEDSDKQLWVGTFFRRT